MNRAAALCAIAGVVVGLLAGLAWGGGEGARRGGEGADDGATAGFLADMAQRRDQEMERLARVADESAQLQRELALALFYRLQEFRRFGLEGQIVTWLVPAGGDLAGAERVPRLAVDAAARADWEAAAGRLGGVRAEVDPAVFSAFEDVLAFIAERPWPAGAGVRAAVAGGWSDAAAVEAWLALNRALVDRADAILAGF